jgi:hypothetical protein
VAANDPTKPPPRKPGTAEALQGSFFFSVSSPDHWVLFQRGCHSLSLLHSFRRILHMHTENNKHIVAYGITDFTVAYRLAQCAMAMAIKKCKLRHDISLNSLHSSLQRGQ